jgi:hypothetical protein
MGNGEWVMGDGQWVMEDKQLTIPSETEPNSILFVGAKKCPSVPKGRARLK